MRVILLLAALVVAGCAQQEPYLMIGKDQCLIIQDGPNAGVYCKEEQVLEFYHCTKARP